MYVSIKNAKPTQPGGERRIPPAAYPLRPEHHPEPHDRPNPIPLPFHLATPDISRRTAPSKEQP